LSKIDGDDYNTQWIDQSSGYDQSLNTTDSVVFAGLRVNGDSRLNAIIADDDTQKVVVSADYTGEGSGAGGIITVGSTGADIGNKITITAGAVQIQNLTYPSVDGTSGQVLSTDGAGVLSWTTAGGGSSIPLITAAETTATTTATGKLVSISDNGGRLAYYNDTITNWLYVFNDTVVYTPPTPPAGNDPFYADVKFLLEATPNVDVKGNVSISNSGVTQSSTQTKFGNTYSWLLDGAGTTNLTISNAINQMGTSDWTMDMWMWSSSANTDYNALFAWDNECEYRHEPNGNWYWYDFGQGIYPAAFGTQPTENGWTFFTIERHGSNFNLYLDGVRIYQGSATSMNINNSTIWFGSETNNKGWAGYFDYIRLTQAARHEGADFTPPASAAEYEPAA